MTTSDRVRKRLRDEIEARGISQRAIADKLTGLTGEIWTQSKVGKVLTGYVELKIDDADHIANASGITLTEAVRDRGLEFYAELTPSEMRVIELLRRRGPLFLTALLTILYGDSSILMKAVKRGRAMNSQRQRRPVKIVG